MIKTLKQIATIQTGYSFRRRLEVTLHGELSVIQMKDLQDDNTVNLDNLSKIDLIEIKKHHLAQKGDLIFRSRGFATTSAILLKDPGKAIIAAPLLRIRVKDSKIVLPEYLNWYMSQNEAQKFFTSRALGSIHKMINLQTIENLEIILPDLKTQKTIIELASLSLLEEKLNNQIAEKRKQYINAVLSKVLKGES